MSSCLMQLQANPIVERNCEMATPPKHLRSLREYIEEFAAIDDVQPSDVEVERLSRPTNEIARAVSVKTESFRAASQAARARSVADSSG
jgi:hypothetical protein